MRNLFTSYNKTSILKVFLFGIINGMNLLLSSNTLNFWLAVYGIDAKIIGFFSCISLPYACKYFIAIFIERFQNRYKLFLITSQIILILSLLLMSLLEPIDHLWLIALLGFFIALASVIQYVIFNGDRIVTLHDKDQIAGSAIYNVGYRIGMFITGVGVIYISSKVSWFNIYITLATIYLLSLFLIFTFYKEPFYIKQTSETSNLREFFLKPAIHFNGYRNLIWVVLFVMLYQMSDSMFMAMLNPFLLAKSYNAGEIASASKFFGIIMVIIGGFISGSITIKLGIKKSLIRFGFFHMVGYIFYALLAMIDKNILALYFVTGYVAFTGGMATTAYLAFISELSKGKNATTLYAFLSSVNGLAWALFPSLSGIMVDSLGWIIFFLTMAIITLTTLLFTYYIPKRIYNMA